MNRYIKRSILVSLFALIVALTMLPVVMAADVGSVNVWFHHDAEAIPGAQFHLYRVAVLADNGEFILTDEFAESKVSLDDYDGDNTASISSTLAAYVAANHPTPYAEGVTNENGGVVMGDIEKGLYLLTGDKVAVDDVMYFPLPTLLTMPSYTTSGTAVYEIQIEPKYEFRPIDGEKLERKVLKIWRDEGYEKERPKEITVRLLRDGEVYDEQKLNAENNWRYTWAELDAIYSWQVVEVDVPDDYEVSIEQQGITFTVTNTYKEPPPDTPPDEPPPEKLPQTGMLWWPVPVLLAVGIVFCILGFKLCAPRRRVERRRHHA